MHPRFQKLIDCQKFYNKKILICDDRYDFEQTLKLAIFKNKKIKDYQIVHINKNKYYIFYNE